MAGLRRLTMKPRTKRSALSVRRRRHPSRSQPSLAPKVCHRDFVALRLRPLPSGTLRRSRTSASPMARAVRPQTIYSLCSTLPGPLSQLGTPWRQRLNPATARVRARSAATMNRSLRSAPGVLPILLAISIEMGSQRHPYVHHLCCTQRRRVLNVNARHSPPQNPDRSPRSRPLLLDHIRLRQATALPVR